MKVDEQLEAARRMIEGDDVAPSVKQIAEGAKIVRDLAEKGNCLEVWRDMLTDEVFFMFERNLSKSPELKNAAIASGVMPVGACFMHTGFSLPIPGGGTGDESVEGMLDGLLVDLKIPRKRPVSLSKAQTASFAAVSIKSWIAAGMEGPVRMGFR